MNLTYADAQKIVAAALAKSDEMKVPVSVAVLDSGRELLAFARQDGATLLSAEVSQWKAFTARSLNMATSDVGPLTQPGQPLYGLEVSSRHRIVTFAGGHPLRVNGEVVGAVGVSGGSVDQDDEIALVAVGSLT